MGELKAIEKDNKTMIVSITAIGNARSEPDVTWFGFCLFSSFSLALVSVCVLMFVNVRYS